jgi:hypothetical protein
MNHREFLEYTISVIEDFKRKDLKRLEDAEKLIEEILKRYGKIWIFNAKPYYPPKIVKEGLLALMRDSFGAFEEQEFEHKIGYGAPDQKLYEIGKIVQKLIQTLPDFILNMKVD